ncbi:MAG: hypothetical protein AAF333_17110 [Planctomycetota bacterium]
MAVISHWLKQSVWILGLVALAGGVGSVAAQPAEADSAIEGEAGAPATDPGSDDPTVVGPQAVFERAQQAYNERDWVAFVDTVSPNRRDELIGQFAVVLTNLAQQPEADTRVVDLVERHVPKDLDPTDLMMGSDDPQAELVRLARRMRDGQGFFAEAMAVVFALEFGEEADDVKLVELTDVVIDEPGDNAVGKVTVLTPDGPRPDVWTFEKFEDDWYLSMKN